MTFCCIEWNWTGISWDFKQVKFWWDVRAQQDEDGAMYLLENPRV